MANIWFLMYYISYMANIIGKQKAMANRVEIGEKARMARKSLGYTQQVLSELTNINKTTISEIENGRFTGSFDIFERVLDAVGLQFEVTQKQHSLPDWDDIEAMFSEDNE